MNFVEKLFDKLLNDYTGDDEAKYNYILELVTVALSLGIHLFLLFYFVYIKNSYFAIINVFIVLMYAGCMYLTKKNKFKLVGLILTLEIYLHTLFATIYFGVQSAFYFYFLIVIFTQLTLPYAHTKVRGFFILLYLFTMQILFIADIVPIIKLHSTALKIIRFFNLNSAVIGFLVTLYIGTLTKKSIESYNLRQLEEYRQKAHYDNLTKIGNRNYAEKIFSVLQSQSSSEDYVIAMMDLDNFKTINDTYGHAFGDAMLETIAQKTSKLLRSTDYVFRWGGEEFLMVLSNISCESAYLILERIRQSIQDLVFVSESKKNACITVTIGYAKLNLDDIQAGIEECDRNMYLGKLAQKNIVCNGKIGTGC